MTSFSRGLMGLSNHSFAAGMLRTQRAAASGAKSGAGGSHILYALRLRLFRPSTFPNAQFFSSSSPLRGKGPARGKVPKNAAPPATTARTAPPPPRSQPQPQPQAKPGASPVTRAAASSLPRSASAAAGAAASSPSSSAGAARSFAEQLGHRSVSTLLYKAPSHFWFRATSLTAGLLTIAYTLTNYWSVFISPPEGLLWWVPHAFGVICVVMISGGIYFLMGGFGIIRVINAIPSSRIGELAGKGAASTAARMVKDAGGGAPPPVFLEIEIGRVLPILPARKRYVLPTALVIPSRLAAYGLSGDNASASAATTTGAGGSQPLTGYERVQAHEAEQERLEKLRAYERDHLMTAPFRHAGQGAQTGFRQMQRVFSREGFIKVLVNGDRQKLDITGGWALENGRALDRLATITNKLA